MLWMHSKNLSRLLSTERRSCPLSCLRMLPWGVEVCSLLWEGSRAARQGWSRTFWRRTKRSAHLLETLLSPHSSYISTSTHVTLCLITGKSLCNEPFILYICPLKFTLINFRTSNFIFIMFYFNYTNRCAFFLGEIDKPAQGILQRGKRKVVNVGICLEGVYVMDVKEKVSAGLKHALPCFSLWTCAFLDNHRAHCVKLKADLISRHENYPDFSCRTPFLAARAARPAFQWAFLGPQLPRGGGGLAHSVAGVRRRGRRHSCQQVAEDLLKTSKKMFVK